MENKRNRDFLLIIIISILIGALLTSCSKDEITPGNYTAGTVTVGQQNNWQADYQDSGVLPTWGTNTSGTNNQLVGTTWVLTKVVSGFSTTFPNDTIRFVSNTNYTLNNGAVRPYTLTSSAGTTNKTLTLNFFQPFGGSHYSGQVGFYFVTDGSIVNAEFHNIQNTTSTLRAWFTKL